MELGDIKIRGDRVELELGTIQAILTHAGTSIAGDWTTASTPSGALHFPRELPAEKAREAAGALSREAVTLPWQEVFVPWKPGERKRPSVDIPIDARRAAKIKALRARAVALREGRSMAVEPLPLPDPPLRLPLDPAAPDPPLGDAQISAWLAAGSFRHPRCPNGGRCMEAELADIVAYPDRVSAERLRGYVITHRGETKLWALAARVALLGGHFAEALSWADVATRMERTDADALAVWSRLTGARPGADPAGFPAVLGAEDQAVSPHGQLGLLLAAMLLLALAWRRRRTWGRLVLGLTGAGLLAGLLAWWSFQERPLHLEVPERPPSLVAPLAGSPCAADPALWTHRAMVYYATCAGAPISFEIFPGQGDPQGGLQAAHHWLRVSGPEQSDLTDAAARLLFEALRTAEDQGFRVDAWPSEEVHGASSARLLPHQRIELATSAAFAAASLLFLFLVLLHSARLLRAAARADRIFAHGLLLLLGCAILLHLLLPSRIVLVYTGYSLVDDLSTLRRIPRYGAGLFWLYTPFLKLLGPDIASMQVANRLFGLLTWLPVAACCVALAEISGAPRGSARARWSLVGIAFFTLSPFVLRDHVSESNLSAATLLLFSGLAALLLGLHARSRRGLLVAAVPILAWAATCRPEITPVIACLGLAALILGARPEPAGAARERGVIAILGVALAAALLPHILWLLAELRWQEHATGIKRVGGSFLPRFEAALRHQNIFVAAPWYQWPVLIWPALALLTRRAAVWAMFMALGGATWVAISGVDLPLASIPRLHVPPMLLLVPVLGIGAAWVARGRRRRWLNLPIAAAVIFVSVWSLPVLFRAGNHQAEDALIQEARAVIPAGSACLATVRADDPPVPGKTHRHFPDYLFPGTEILGLDALPGAWERCQGRTWAILGTRCYMRMRAPGQPPPPAPGTLPVCTRFRQRWRLQPIVERTVPNVTTLCFPEYPDSPTLDLGLYKVLGPTEPPAKK